MVEHYSSVFDHLVGLALKGLGNSTHRNLLNQLEIQVYTMWINTAWELQMPNE